MDHDEFVAWLLMLGCGWYEIQTQRGDCTYYYPATMAGFPLWTAKGGMSRREFEATILFEVTVYTTPSYRWRRYGKSSEGSNHTLPGACIESREFPATVLAREAIRCLIEGLINEPRGDG